MDWATRRKIIYAVSTGLFCILLGVYLARGILFPVPTCFDSKKNGNETAVDCGGSCSLRCTSSVTPITVEWSAALETGTGIYDLVAMVANKNTSSAPRSIAYTLIPVDARGVTLGEYTGVSTSIVEGEVPIVVQNVELATRPSRVLVRTAPAPFYAVAPRELPPVRVTGTRYEAGDIPRIYVTIRNTTRTVFIKIPVRMVAFDSSDNVIAAGESIIPLLEKEGVQDVVFTWNQQLRTAPAKIRAYPVIDPFMDVK